jgi:hypothetical protein
MLIFNNKHFKTIKNMKKTFLIMGLATMLCASPLTNFYSMAEVNSISVTQGWEKAKDGIWPGKDGVWYKVDKMGKIWWSKDGKKWEASADGMWQDKDGKWLKINNKMLVWSADGGKTWVDVPEWKWQAADGKWYKFDKDWTLWMNA